MASLTQENKIFPCYCYISGLLLFIVLYYFHVNFYNLVECYMHIS